MKKIEEMLEQKFKSYEENISSYLAANDGLLRKRINELNFKLNDLQASIKNSDEVNLETFKAKDRDVSHINGTFRNYAFRYTSEITPFSRECFFTSLWRTIKNSGQAGSGQEDRLKKIIKKRKRNKNLKLPSFCAVFNCSNRADKEKDESNYRFP